MSNKLAVSKTIIVLILVAVAVIIIIAGVALYSAPSDPNPSPTPTPTPSPSPQITPSPTDIISIEDERESNMQGVDPNVLSGKEYDISYTDGEIIETWGENVSFTIHVQRVTFKDSASAKNYTEYVFDAFTNGELISKPESLSIEEFEGHSFVTHHIESRSETGHGLLIRKEDVIIYGGGNGLDRDTVVKVIGWLIDQT